MARIVNERYHFCQDSGIDILEGEWVESDWHQFVVFPKNWMLAITAFGEEMKQKGISFMKDNRVTTKEDLKRIVNFKIGFAVSMDSIIHNRANYEDFYVKNCNVYFEENAYGDEDAYFKGELGAFLKSDNPEIRAALAKNGWALDILINDSNENVRCEVAKQGYGWEKLAIDSSHKVRLAVSIAKDGFDAHSDEFFQQTANNIAAIWGL